MTDPKQIIFDNGCSLLKEGDFVGFAEAIIEIHVNHSLCDCFFKGQPTSIWPFLLDITTLIGADDSFDTKGYDDDFHLNFSKGFLFLQIIDYNEAYYYLTRSIDAKALFDVSYNIRSRIPEKYNKGYLQDAVEAALLRGSATNYLTFANLVRNCESESVGGCLIKSSESFGIDKVNARKSILIYNKILVLDKSFSCLYADKGLAHMTLEEYDVAADLFTTSLKINPIYWPWNALWHCLNKLDEKSRYYDIMNFLKVSVSSSDANKILYLELATVNEHLGDYEKAIEYNNMYLKNFPNNVNNESRSENLSEKLSRNMQANGTHLSVKGQYKEAIFCFNIFLEKHKFQDLKHVDFYLKTLVKSNNVFIDDIEEKPLYKEIEKLRENFRKKMELGIEPSEKEVNASRIKVYHAKNKINFGEYAGSVINEIIINNAEYILWCIVNLDHFALWNGDMVNKYFFQEELYAKAAEINLIKNGIVWDWESALQDEHDDDMESYRNYNWEEETFNALTDGQLGDWDDFGGDIDDAKDSMGLN